MSQNYHFVNSIFRYESIAVWYTWLHQIRYMTRQNRRAFVEKYSTKLSCGEALLQPHVSGVSATRFRRLKGLKEFFRVPSHRKANLHGAARNVSQRFSKLRNSSRTYFLAAIFEITVEMYVFTYRNIFTCLVLPWQ